MAAQPKKRTSHSKGAMRRSHDRLKVGTLVLCSHCRRPHRPHHVCPNCGYYRGREALPEKPVRGE